MNKKDFSSSINNIDPNDIKKKRIWSKVMDKPKKNAFKFNFRVAVPVLSLALVVAIGAFLFKPKNNGNFMLLPGEVVNDSAGRELAIAPIINQFEIGNKKYIILSDDLRKAYGFTENVAPEQIGEKITTIDKAQDKALIGKEVYFYIPAKCEAVVALKDGNLYKLFKFFNFASYENNQDEDVSEYLKLYGINSAMDITKIQFIGYSEKAKLENRVDIKAEIVDKTEIKKFYDYYSVLKNSSDKYFKKLFGSKTDNPVTPPTPQPAARDLVPPDNMQPADNATSNSTSSPAANGTTNPNGTINTGVSTDSGPTTVTYGSGAVDLPTTTPQKGESTQGSVGTAGNALANSQTIRIYTESGIYFEVIYYPNIGFISRHETGTELASFLNKYIK